jgi:hypothetical protein
MNLLLDTHRCFGNITPHSASSMRATIFMAQKSRMAQTIRLFRQRLKPAQ